MAKIGLYNLEPNIINSALMRISTYHKNLGDQVETYSPLFHNEYDKVYASSIFKFTDKGYVTKDMITGGTGFNLNSKLPKEIEQCDYDWSLYPNCDYSIIWFSVGCVRNCDFCVVRQKEGNIKAIQPKNLNPNSKYIKVMDNNFFASPNWKDAINKLLEYNQPVDFQGVDARLLTPEMCMSLNKLKHKKQIKIAWDNPKFNLIPKLKKILTNLKAYKLMCYVLIGFDSTPEEDLYRVEELRKLKIDPFVMPFDKSNRYQKDFARWVNHKAVWRKVKWKDYKKKD